MNWPQESLSTRAQQALWASQLLHRDAPLYNMAFTFAIDGAVDETSFASAFRQLVADADALRTVVDSADGVPFQLVQRELEFDLAVVDLTAGPIDRALGITTVQLHTAAATSERSSTCARSRSCDPWTGTCSRTSRGCRRTDATPSRSWPAT